MSPEPVTRYTLRAVDYGWGPRVYELQGGPDVGSLDGVELVLAEDFDRLIGLMRETLLQLEDMLQRPM